MSIDKNNSEMDAIIERLRPLVEDAERPSLVLGAMVYWVSKLIKWSSDPDETMSSVIALIRQGVRNK